MSKEKITAVLRVYKGDAKGELNYKSDGKGGFDVSSENQKLSLTFKDPQWEGHISRLPKMGFAKIKVEAVYSGNDLVEMPEVQADIERILKPQAVTLTPDQQRIADLEAKIESLMKGSQKAPVQEPIPANDEALDALRAEFKEKAGKEAHKLWGEKRLSEEIAKLNN